MLFFEKFHFFTFFGCFPPQGRKKVIFWKKVKLNQNHVLRVFFPRIFDFGVRKTKQHRFGGLNDLPLGWYEKLTTSKIFIFEQKKIRFFRVFWVFSPPGAKKSDFLKKVKLTPNHFLGVFFPKIYDFKARKTKKHRFGGLNDLRLRWYEKLATSIIFIFKQKIFLIFQFFFWFFFFFVSTFLLYIIT